MDGQEYLFVIFGIRWTFPLLVTVVGGTLTALLTLYKLVERWNTREQRRLDMLREYIDREEKNISSRRKGILDSIRMSRHSYLSDKKLDVGAEIDRAIQLLDRGYPELASGQLKELEKRLDTNEKVLRRRADDLQKHMASVQIFLAAIADRCAEPNIGLAHIDKAISYDRLDLDALHYKALLLLNRGDLPGAEQAYDLLRKNSNGQENASYRAYAYFGLGTVNFKRGSAYFLDAARSLANALQNMSLVPSSEQDHYAIAQIHALQGRLLSTADWEGYEPRKAMECFGKALNSLNQVPNKREAVSLEIRDVKAAIQQIQPQT